jgi:hypothetical protein
MPEEVGMAGEIELDPRYSTREVPGKCIKCLAEQKYGDCLRELLKGKSGEDIERVYEALVSFLTSSELERLRDESEKYLSEGKQVTVKIYLAGGEPKYELKVVEESKGRLL